MIQPLQLNSNLSFRANDKAQSFKTEMPFKIPEKFVVAQNAPLDTKMTVEESAAGKVESQENSNELPQNKTGVVEKFNSLKKNVVNIFKGVNNVTGTTQGAIKGVAGGMVAASIVGVIGKNAKDGHGKIVSTAAGIAKDIGKGVYHAVGFVPSLLTKSPLTNVKNVVTLPKKFFGKEYLNVCGKEIEKKTGKEITKYSTSHKLTAALATLVGVGVFAYKTIQGKVRANVKNANLDHQTNLGHVK